MPKISTSGLSDHMGILPCSRLVCPPLETADTDAKLFGVSDVTAVLPHDCGVTIFLLCYNESTLLPHTIRHYMRWLPNARMVVLDNESADNSRQIALEG